MDRLPFSGSVSVGEDDVDRRVGTGRHLDRGWRRRVETVRRSDGQGVVAWLDGADLDLSGVAALVIRRVVADGDDG